MRPPRSSVTCEIGAESSVWMNVFVIRGDVNGIRIGRRSNLQDGTVVHVMHDTHPTTIGDDVTVGHGGDCARLHDRGRVLIGMGAIVLNGASWARIRSWPPGSLVPKAAIVPPRWLRDGHAGEASSGQLKDAEVASMSFWNTPAELQSIPARLHDRSRESVIPAVRGTHDILPGDVEKWQTVERVGAHAVRSLRVRRGPHAGARTRRAVRERHRRDDRHRPERDVQLHGQGR